MAISFYKDANSWKINGNPEPTQTYRALYSSGNTKVTVVLPGAGQSPLFDRTLITEIEKNAAGDLYANFAEFDISVGSFFLNASSGGIPGLDEFISVTPEGDDKGISIINGQLSVGSPESPQESVFGSGDSYPVDIAFHCDIADTTGLVIVNAVNKTAVFRSDNSSSDGLFGGTTTGKYILVGSDYTFGGAKIKNVAAANIDPNNIVAEYNPLGLGWISALLMVSDANPPLIQKANKIGTCANCSEQWRFGFNPLELPVVWDKVILNINGVDIEKYWARFRITSNIAEDLVVQQIKQHTNRFEVNSDGSSEYFGSARYPKSLLIHQRLLDELDGAAPKDAAIDFALGISGKLKKNKFENTKIDGYAHILTIPDGLDTSIPITIKVNYVVDNATSGQVEMSTETAQIQLGDKLDGTHPIEFSEFKIIPVPLNSEFVLKQGVHLLPIDKLMPGEFLVFKFQRDATVGNAADTYAGNVNIVSIQGIGYFWKP